VAAPVRGTQSFVHTLSACWRRPALTALEVAWRWLYGIPALALVYLQLKKVLLAATSGTMDPASLGLDKTLLNDPVGALSADPLGAAGKFSHAIAMVLPGLSHVAAWALPLLVVAWIVVSSLGRILVLRRADSALHARPVTLMLLQTLRMAVLSAVFLAWYKGIEASGRFAIQAPVAAGTEPNLVLYCALVIVLSLGLFTLWGFVSWLLSMAPLLAMIEDLGALASLRAAAHLGPLQGKLVEVNLVLGIVKIALIVLAMVFSATPLPFQDVTTPEFLAWWWAGVTLLYLLWSDFFHVARLLAYLNLWRVYARPPDTAGK
jgi:hypothetical protein